MAALRIILLAVLACVLYGIVHDQITVRICLEYFTVMHPPVFSTTNPTWLAMGWGIIATWWVGVLIGVPLAVVSRAGSLPQRTAADLLRPLLKLMLVAGCLATLAGVAGYVAAVNGWVYVMEPWASRVPPENHVWLLVDLWAHSASYAAGFFGGILLLIDVWRGRVREGESSASALCPASDKSASP